LIEAEHGGQGVEIRSLLLTVVSTMLAVHSWSGSAAPSVRHTMRMIIADDSVR